MSSSRTCDIAELLTVLETTGQAIPQAIRQAERLTRFAVFTRYPGIAPPISREEYTEALRVAGEVIRWVDNLLRCSPVNEGCAPSPGGRCVCPPLPVPSAEAGVQAPAMPD